MAIVPERRQEIIDEIAARNAQRMQDALLTALDTGWLLFAKAKPRERYTAYVQNTYPPDIPYVLDPEYLDKVGRGEAPLLPSLALIQSGAQVDVPMLWPQVVSTLPGYVFERLSRDFKHLMQEQARRNGRALGEGES